MKLIRLVTSSEYEILINPDHILFISINGYKDVADRTIQMKLSDGSYFNLPYTLHDFQDLINRESKTDNQ